MVPIRTSAFHKRHFIDVLTFAAVNRFILAPFMIFWGKTKHSKKNHSTKLRKTPSFHLIFWCENFVEMQSSSRVSGECLVPFHKISTKLGQITVFYVVQLVCVIIVIQEKKWIDEFLMLTWFKKIWKAYPIKKLRIRFYWIIHKVWHFWRTHDQYIKVLLQK